MLSDDPGAGGALRNFTDRRDVLLRAARHFRASAASDSAQRSAADSYRSLEEVLHQLGDAAGARAAYAAYVRARRGRAAAAAARGARAGARGACAARGGAPRHRAPLPPRALCRAAAAPPPAAVERYRARGYAHLPARRCSRPTRWPTSRRTSRRSARAAASTRTSRRRRTASTTRSSRRIGGRWTMTRSASSWRSSLRRSSRR